MLPRRLLAWTVLLPACAVSLGGRPKVDQLPPSTRLVLDNGLEAILIPNRTTPLITAVAVVRSGSALESPATSGISHMLEHLLFSGTARRTQEQIEAAPRTFGLVNNAHTAAEHTAYFVLAPREQFAEALDLQADMLLASLIPEERLTQEREIIANEIAKDQVQDEAALSGLYAERLYSGGLSLPVIGTPASVRAIPREQLVAWHQAWYAPNNMTLIVMGDFEPAEMEPLVQRLFGHAAPRHLPEPSREAPAVRAAALGRTHTLPSEATRRLWMGAPAPGMNDPLFSAARALAALLGKGLLPAVNARLGAAGRPGSLLEASAGLDAYTRVGTFQVRAVLDAAVAWDDASRALQEELFERLRTTPWSGRDLDTLRLEEKASLLRLWEKPHYFGLDRAPYVAGGGWELARDLAKRMDWVERADLQDLGRPLASAGGWAIFMAGSGAPPDAGAPPAEPAGSPDRGAPEKPRFTRESRALVDGWKPPPAPPAGSVAPLAAARPGADGRPAASLPVVRTFVPNGMRIILDSTDDSRVFAAHVLVRDRALAEPAGKEGVAEVLHAMLASAGTTARPGERLQDALRAMGGSLKTADDPAIPYDDIYLSPEYSYIRLEALDEFAPEALDLLRELLESPALSDERAFSMARDQQLARVRRSSASPRDRARLAVARAVWGASHPAARSPFGTEAALSSLTLADVRAFHATYFHPRNLIVAIGTAHRPEAILPMVESRLGRWERPGKPPSDRSWPSPARAPEGAGDAGPAHVAEDLAGPQGYVAWGRLAPSQDAATLSAVAAVLSARMGRTLREQRGLAYALGADASPLAGMVQWTAGMGVLPEKIGEARAGLREMILSLVEDPPGQTELDAAARDTRVRMLMRGLSRINRAWKRCVDETRAADPRRVPEASAPPASVPAEQAEALVRSLIVPSALGPWAEAVVGPPAAPPPGP